MRLLIVTAPQKEAAELGKKIVEERLAACVNIVPAVRSIYRWQGKIEDDEESMMFFKTVDEQVSDVTARIKELHSYDVPEIVSVELKSDEGNPDYLDWVRQSVEKK